VSQRNAIVSLLRQLIPAFIVFVGLADVLRRPGLTGSDIVLSLRKLSLFIRSRFGSCG
jgi:hypothetical protein